jgi:4-amino-4-deoxy-L-arabinose transferase-like glycosyltransferase
MLTSMPIEANNALKDFLDFIFSLCSRYPRLLLAALTIAVLSPFLAKPFNMDDPLFIWSAQHIHSRPMNPYGFAVNWYGSAEPMWQVTKNPPLACYYIAAVARLLGWSEVALHAALLLPALAVVLGTYRLASKLCQHPFLAALIILTTPVFLVSCTTIMCDVLMLAFWIWAVVLWTEGLRANNHWQLASAGVLIGLAALTKYFGICLLPLLMTHTVLYKRRVGLWIIWLSIPVALLAMYHFATVALYGRSLLTDAADYSRMPTDIFPLLSSKAASFFSSLTFTGGCVCIGLFFAPLLWSLKTLCAFFLSIALFGILLFSSGIVLQDYGPLIGSSRGLLETQVIVWSTGGLCVLALALVQLGKKPSPESWLLALWVFGTFFFAAFFNWTVNGRTILPLTPAATILVVRQLERNTSLSWKISSRTIFVCFTLSAILALLVTRADYLFAKSVRESARVTCQRYRGGPTQFWFQGHWGFQFYMEKFGAHSLDEARSKLKRGDLIAASVNNANYLPLKSDLAVLREIISVPGPRYLTTMRGEVGAGFYASVRGPLPFAFGLVPPETVAVCALEPDSKTGQ